MGEIAMAAHDEGSGGGAMSVLIWAAVSALLMGWVMVTLHAGRKIEAATAPQKTEAPATTAARASEASRTAPMQNPIREIHERCLITPSSGQR